MTNDHGRGGGGDEIIIHQTIIFNWLCNFCFTGLVLHESKRKDGYFIHLFFVKPVMYEGKNYQPVLNFNVII